MAFISVGNNEVLPLEDSIVQAGLGLT